MCVLTCVLRVAQITEMGSSGTPGVVFEVLSLLRCCSGPFTCSPFPGPDFFLLGPQTSEHSSLSLESEDF